MTEVEKLTSWMLVTDEDFVDYAMGTPAQRAEAAARIDARMAVVRASWNALPWYVKVARRWAWRRADWERRLAHARQALRGIECERD